MTSSEKLSVRSYIASEIAQFRLDGDRPPKSAKFVVSLDCGGGPGGGDYRTYLICTDRQRSVWTLWQVGHDYDTGKRMYCRVAEGSPYRTGTAVEACRILLDAAWRNEIQQGQLLRKVVVTVPGLLDHADIQRIIGQLTLELD